MRMQYWLFKSEPTSYSIDDLKRDRRTAWTGVRNFQARNLMRDHVQKGDLGFFYHSSAEVIGIVGLVKVVSSAYEDPTQFDTTSTYYDPKSKKDSPTWVVVDLAFQKKFKTPVSLSHIKNDPFFKDMPLTKRGMRLSVQPVSKKHFNKILESVI